MITSTVTALPTLCPNLQSIGFYSLPKDSIAAAVSGMLLVTNWNTLQHTYVDSRLTDEASEVRYKPSNLCSLSVAIERKTSLPSASLPHLTKLAITCDNKDDWPRLFHGATLGKLGSVSIPESEQISDFLGAFQRAALSSSVHNALSEFCLLASCSWNPDYSLLAFTQMVDLHITSSCDDGCSSRMDDDIAINLSRAMAKLEDLRLGDDLCPQFAAGVTVNGLVTLAHHFPNLSIPRTHSQVDSPSDPPTSPGVTPNAESTASCTDYALTDLEVGEISVSEE